MTGCFVELVDVTEQSPVCSSNVHTFSMSFETGRAALVLAAWLEVFGENILE